MIFILYSGIDERSIGSSLGLPEYSYFFVLKSYRKALERLGQVVHAKSLDEVDRFYSVFNAAGLDCLFLSFNPPHKTPVGLQCPTCPVFAWEAGSIPSEVWDGDERNDWRTVFRQHGQAICLSEHTAAIVRSEMGEDFPILALPTPLWESFEESRGRISLSPINSGTSLSIRGLIMDSRAMALRPELPPPPPPPPPPPGRKTLRYRLWVIRQHLMAIYHEALIDLLPVWLRLPFHHLLRGAARLLRKPRVAAASEPPPPLPEAGDGTLRTQLNGVVYTSVLNPKDGRKNWANILTAFCWAFRDTDDATLVLKMSQKDLSTYEPELLDLLQRLSPFRCRVVVLHGYLDDAEYEALIAGSSYYVNASLSEGLCLPLMEFLCCGKPVIAPRHTAMEDYLDDSMGFVLDCTQEHSVWPHDERRLYRALRYRPKWKSLEQAYRESYRVAKEEPQHYAEMSTHARQRMQNYCALPPITDKLGRFLMKIQPSAVAKEQQISAGQPASC